MTFYTRFLSCNIFCVSRGRQTLWKIFYHKKAKNNNKLNNQCFASYFCLFAVHSKSMSQNDDSSKGWVVMVRVSIRVRILFWTKWQQNDYKIVVFNKRLHKTGQLPNSMQLKKKGDYHNEHNDSGAFLQFKKYFYNLHF